MTKRSLAARAKPFLGPKLKLQRGRWHKENLKAVIDKYLASDPFITLKIRNKMNDKIELLTASSGDVPQIFSLIFGDSVHNFRTALDILANDLVALSNTQPRRVSFPFATNAKNLEIEIAKKLDGLAADIIEMIRKLAPFTGGNALLRAIHDLDINDKHIAIIGLGQAASSPSLPMRPMKVDDPSILFAIEADFGALDVDPVDLSSYRIPPIEDIEIIGKVRGYTTSLAINPDLALGGEDPIVVLDNMGKLVEHIGKTFEAHCLGRQ